MFTTVKDVIEKLQTYKDDTLIAIRVDENKLHPFAVSSDHWLDNITEERNIDNHKVIVINV
jgi:hypothetical protein